MKLARNLCVLGLWLLLAPNALADVSTPEATQPPPAITQPTAPAVDSAPPTEVVPPISDTPPVDVSREHGQVGNSATETAPAAATPAPMPTAHYETGPSVPGVTLNPGPQRTNSSSSAVRSSGPATGSPSSSVSVSEASPSGIDSSLTAPYPSVSSPAPAQLTCHGHSHGDALPFLVAPYAGWTEIASFVDHDSPDYTVDGSIVLANGITATAADGQASDAFPAYWSPALRQFVNYDGHNGYDFEISYQPVLAAASGTVTFAGWNSTDQYAGYGQMILIDHHNGYSTLYGHLSEIDVHEGQKVTAGDQIGISGSTGHSSGPHLHFSVFHNCSVTDPYGWTGSGTDPLYSFDHERATYLWLPGRDPLVLNPPRDWPTYPLGLRLPLSAKGAGADASRAARLNIPPASRLVLLNLPQSRHVGTTSPAVALARTEAAINQEAESLGPQLDDLQSQGLIERYQLIPAAAAIWLRGTVSAAQLLDLSGVASLAGVLPRDADAAQAGLAHAVLVQIGRQQVPSLWPVGFRSALDAWRPVATIINGHALVTGVALPGRRVVISLRRRTNIAAVAVTTADADTGGFVSMLHDASGSPVPTRPGDVVSIESSGKFASIAVVPLTLRARADAVRGQAAGGSSVPIALTRVGGALIGAAEVTADASGSFALPAGQLYPAGSLPAGELAVGSVADAAGNQEAASAFVPGIEVMEGSSLVRGWTVGNAPRLALIRLGRAVLDRRIYPAPDGTFQLDLQAHHQLVPLSPGDTLRIGSRLHPRYLVIPKLSIALRSDAEGVEIRAPKDSRIALSLATASGRTISRSIDMGGVDARQLSLPGLSLSVGAVATLRFISSVGDAVLASSQTRSIVVHEGSATVSGTVHPGTALSVHVLSTKGARIGSGIATADLHDGSFSMTLRNDLGAAISLRSAVRLEIRDALSTTTTLIPALRMVRKGNAVLTRAILLPHETALWTGIDKSGATLTRRLFTAGKPTMVDRAGIEQGGRTLTRVIVSATVGDGISVERTLNFDAARVHRVAAMKSRHGTACSSHVPSGSRSISRSCQATPVRGR